MAPRRQVPALCPFLPFLAHTCAPAGTGTGMHTPSPGSSGGHSVAECHRQSHGSSRWLSACLAVHDGEHGEGQSPRSTPAACAPWSSQRCAYAPVRGRLGSRCHNSGEGQPCLGRALLTGWLLGRPCSLSPPMTPLLGTETSTCLSSGHGWSHCGVTLLYSLRPFLLHGEHALGGWEGAPDAP